ncbi:MAG: substrate-binding periplasmic protein [Solirubrobacterales bacterium]
MFRAKWAALVVAFLLASGPAARAADLRFISVDAPPWGGYDTAGEPTGAFPDIVREIEHRTGHHVAVSLQSLARIERDLETGEQDCTILLWNEARARYVDRGDDVYMMTFGVIAAAGIPLRKYEDLHRLTVSVVRNLSIDPRFDQDAAVRKDFDKDYEIGVKKIAHRRLDGIAGAIPTILWIAKQSGLSDRLGDRLVLTRIPLALQCSKRSPQIGRIGEINAAIQAIRADGTLGRILNEHGYF